MEIKTLDNVIINTDKLPDAYAEMIELIEKSKIYEFAKQNDGFCYIALAIPNHKPWTKMHLDDKTKFDYFLGLVDSLINRVYQGKYRLAIVPVEENPAEL